jgi:hypothetical protein
MEKYRRVIDITVGRLELSVWHVSVKYLGRWKEFDFRISPVSPHQSPLTLLSKSFLTGKWAFCKLERAGDKPVL